MQAKTKGMRGQRQLEQSLQDNERQRLLEQSLQDNERRSSGSSEFGEKDWAKVEAQAGCRGNEADASGAGKHVGR